MNSFSWHIMCFINFFLSLQLLTHLLACFDCRYTKNRRGKMVPSRNGTSIDSSSQFHDGPAFPDFFELKDLIATWPMKKLSCAFTEPLIEYGLGRPLGFPAEGLVKEILAAAKSQDYQMVYCIQSIVQSKESQSKQTAHHE